MEAEKYYCNSCGEETPKGRRKYCSKKCQINFFGKLKNQETFTKKELEIFKRQLFFFMKGLEGKKFIVDYIDALKVVHYYTIFYGVEYTKFSVEDELIYMVDKLKKIVNYEYCEL